MTEHVKTLRRWRMEQQLTQADVADLIGRTQREVSRWESHYTASVHNAIGEKNGKVFERLTKGEVRWPESWTNEALDACPYTKVGDLRAITSIARVEHMNALNAKRRRAVEGDD